MERTAVTMEQASDLSYSTHRSHEMRQKCECVCLAIKHVWTFLEEHLALANTHGAEFISHGHWDKFVPQKAQEQLLSLTRDELIKLSQYCGGDLTRTANHQDGATDISSEKTGDWLHIFSDKAHKCHLQNLDVLSPVSDVFSGHNWHSDGGDGPRDPDVISEAMSVKKVHEVGAMAEAVAQLFNSCNADIVVDIGSGKGYLSCELARHHSVPVLGLDSSVINTHGALQRDGKLGQRWKGLVTRKEKKRQSGGHTSSSKNISETFVMDLTTGNCEHSKTSGNSCDTRQKLTDDYRNKTLSAKNVSLTGLAFPCTCDSDAKCRHQGAVCDLPGEKLKSTCVNGPAESENADEVSSLEHIDHHYLRGDHTRRPVDRNDCGGCSGNQGVMTPSCDETCTENTNVCKSQDLQDRTDTSLHEPSQNLLTNEYITPAQTIASGVSTDPLSEDAVLLLERTASHGSIKERNEVKFSDGGKLPLYVPVTMFVHPEMNLRQVIKDHAGHLCGNKCPFSAELFLTGLHTCGSLAVSVMRLFLQDPGAIGLCYVGCCYQLMEESCSDGDSTRPSDSPDVHFPLSQYGKELRLHLGRNARNLASQSVHRIQASGQLQGGDFYWRALLDVLLRQLGVAIPERIMGMRGLNKRSKSFTEYTKAALKKLGLSADLVTPELLEKVEKEHNDDQQKMSAFFQLKIILSPVIESLILLDRYLFLLEQNCVESAHLVQLFDAVTSPRCYALVARKARK